MLMIFIASIFNPLIKKGRISFKLFVLSFVQYTQQYTEVRLTSLLTAPLQTPLIHGHVSIGLDSSNRYPLKSCKIM